MPKILVIEDEDDIRSDVAKILGYEGFKVLTSNNGRNGILMARKHLPDLVICDIMMPEFNGYQVLTRIRSHPATAAIPFIFLTARAGRNDMRKGMRLGADDYLPKPFTVQELLEAITSRLKRKAVLEKQLADLRLRLGLIMPGEIRNALTGVLGFSEFLTQPETLPGLDEIVQIGQVIHESGLTLQRLVENYMIYTELTLVESHPESTNPWLVREQFDLDRLLSECAWYKAREARRSSDLHLKAPRAGISFSTKSFQKIVIELLDNAFKFSEAGTDVQVVSVVKDDHLLVKVSDQGPGMNERQIAAAMALDDVEVSWFQEQGTGLGLRIAALLAELHGGKLTIHSEAGKGTTVSVIIKAGTTPPEEPAHEPNISD